VITPFILGESLGAVSTGAIRVVAGEVQVDHALAWFSPFSLVIGALTLALCAYLAAIYLTLESSGQVQEDFRLRALWAGGVANGLALLLLPLMARSAPYLWENLWHVQSMPLLLAGGALAVLSPWAIWRQHYRAGRAMAVAQVTVWLWGWALAQWPYLIYPDVTLAGSAAPEPVLRAMLWMVAWGLLLLLPSLWFLFKVFKGRNPAGDA
jgi:cytochrome d ubiquinol oxidase subunit II